MKKSNTYQSSFTHNDTMYEFWYHIRYEMANDNYENIYIYEKLEDAASYNDDSL